MQDFSVQDLLKVCATAIALTASPLMALAAPSYTPATKQPERTQPAPVVTSEGYAELAYDRTFYFEMPMKEGVGEVMTAEGVINAVRYVSEHGGINHLVFMMDTPGGAVFHADAMAAVIAEHREGAEYHIVIRHAISAGTWTVFSCDNVFIIDRGSVGGAVAYRTFSDGTAEASFDIPQMAEQMADLAQSNGHPGALPWAFMHMPAELHYWEENGEPVLSNDPPDSPSSVQQYKLMDSDTEVLTLTSDDAVRVGFADHIDEFDAALVGEEIGTPGWTRANRLGEVIQEIGQIYNELRPLQDEWTQRKLQMPNVRRTRDNRNHPQVAQMIEDRQMVEKRASAYERICDALNELPSVHPEGHIYFAGENGVTIVEDADAWKADAAAARALAGEINAGFRELTAAYRLMEIDEDQLNDIEEKLTRITRRVTDISRAGNAAYWEEHAED